MSIFTELQDRFVYYQNLITYENKPKAAKILFAVALIYLLSPIDLIPDFIPIIGWIDDLIIVPMLISMAFSRIEAARRKDMEEKQKNSVSGQSTPDHCETI